jgi:hypothetical protein
MLAVGGLWDVGWVKGDVFGRDQMVLAVGLSGRWEEG